MGGFTTEPAGKVKAGTTATQAVGGFGDMGFLPKGTLYFYYNVNEDPSANTGVPTSSSTTFAPPTIANGACGAGFTANAYTNFTGSNAQMYAVNDYTTTPTLVSGTAY
jgi:hypothetical protein